MFTTLEGLFEPTVMFFGLSNLLATFQAVIEHFGPNILFFFYLFFLLILYFLFPFSFRTMKKARDNEVT